MSEITYHGNDYVILKRMENTLKKLWLLNSQLSQNCQNIQFNGMPWFSNIVGYQFAFNHAKEQVKEPENARCNAIWLKCGFEFPEPSFQELKARVDHEERLKAHVKELKKQHPNTYHTKAKWTELAEANLHSMELKTKRDAASVENIELVPVHRSC